MNDLERYLLTKEDSSVSSSELRHMGKQAAVRYVQQETPLNSSIAELAKEAGLNLEQIKRVSEYANNDTFATMFKLGFAKNITFPMADATAVSQIINAPKEKVASVEKALIHPRMRYIPGQESVDLENVFSGGDLEKSANVSKVQAFLGQGLPLKDALKRAYPQYTPQQLDDASRSYSQEKMASSDQFSDPDVRDATRKFLDVHTENKNALAEKETLGDLFHIKVSALHDFCKEASRSGNSAGIIGYAVEAAEPSKGLLEVIGDHLGDLAEFGHGDELQKLGMGMIPGNPITGLTQDLEGVSSKLVMAQQAVARTQMAMQELLAILRGPDMSSPASQLFGGGSPQPQVLPGAPQGPVPPQQGMAPPPSLPPQGAPMPQPPQGPGAV